MNIIEYFPFLFIFVCTSVVTCKQKLEYSIDEKLFTIAYLSYQHIAGITKISVSGDEFRKLVLKGRGSPLLIWSLRKPIIVILKIQLSNCIITIFMPKRCLLIMGILVSKLILNIRIWQIIFKNMSFICSVELIPYYKKIKPSITGPALDNKSYVLKSAHLHWGSDNSYGTEHSFSGYK